VGVTRDGPKFVIDALITHQLLLMPEFWAAAPPGVQEMKADADAAAKLASDVAAGKACAGCTSVRAALTPIHSRIWGHLDLLHEVSPEAVQPVVDVIAAKRGYRPRPVEVYYKDVAGQTHRLTI
jgi:hypothetical protein